MMKTMIRVASVAACCLFASVCVAQDWPVKPMRVINPFAPGGFGDTVARPVFEQLGARLGQSIIVESQAGANGTLASNVVAKAAPDGYTILLANLGPLAINPALYPATTADPLKVFAPITQLVSGPLVLVVHPDFPAKSLDALIRYAKENPGKLNYGSAGTGSTTHLAGELLKLKAKVDLLHIPFNGAAPLITNLLGKQVDMGIVNISLARPYVESGKLIPIAVTTLNRSAIMPAVPAFAEVLPGFEVNPWWGLVAPAGTPRPVIDRIQKELVDILRKPDIAERLRQNGLEPEVSTPDAYARQIAADVEKWKEVVRENHITTN